MSSKRLYSVCIVSALTLGASAQAPNGKGTLTGTISDPQGAALQGVRVSLSPGSISALTNTVGQFTLIGVPAGQYTLEANYAGFKKLQIVVTVAPGQTNTVVRTLQIAGSSQNIDVYAPRAGGELEAISRTFNAPNIINVLPADVITSLPNANVADAIGRLPDVTLERDEGEGKYVKVRGTEPRLTHTLLDGVTIATPEPVRQVKLDLIPADLVESVQINKTLEANMEGDGIGGTVDLRTKTAEDRPTIYLESLGGYTPILTGRPTYQFDGTFGKRFLGDQRLGALLSGSYDWNGRGINDVEPGPALAGTYDQRDYRYFRSRWGIGGTLDYRQSNTSSFYLKYLYAYFKNFGDDWIYSPTINSWADATTLTQGGPDGNISFTSLRRRPVQDLGGLQLGGHHVLGSALFNWNLNTSVGRTRDFGYLTQHFAPVGDNAPLNNIPFVLDLSNPLVPHLNPTNGVDIYDPTQYFYNGQSVNNLYNPEVVLGFGASLAVPYTLAGHTSTFEAGGLFRNEHKFENLNTVSYVPTAAANDSSLRMTNFLATDFADPDYYGGAYHEGPVTDVNLVNNFGATTISSSLVGNSFNFVEKVSAGYLMNTTDIGRWRFNIGMRIEGTNDNSLGYLGSSGATRSTGTAPNRVLSSYVSLLPSASVRYGLTPTQGIRLVYSRGLARPDFQDLIPFVGPGSGGNINRFNQGNPYIQPEFGDDVDVLYENNLQRSGLLQAGFYYKHLSNPIVPLQTVTPVSGGGENVVSTTGNAQTAHVYGFEIAFIQHFTELPGLFSGLGVSANYGYTSSSVTFPPYVAPGSVPGGSSVIIGPNRGPEGAKPALIGQAPNSFNVSPTYDKRNLSVRLGMTFNQANVSQYNYSTSNSGPITQGGGGGGLTGPNGDVYFYNHLQLDLQGSYRMPKGFTFVMYGLNLNNEVFGFYNGGPNYPVQREFYRQTLGGGLRWSPRLER